ncbi:unnamed protein product [Ranitomeya imitator]|uniref:Breast cancer type 2 susceptibility protein helical domain-containing protein n=1 Tax=Ranitomeya imitator TaxID=111125 RepID=A0ABN9L700_9NEOB|nr:unnamed protein product [Ranitomeya imitator]
MLNDVHVCLNWPNVLCSLPEVTRTDLSLQNCGDMSDIDQCVRENLTKVYRPENHQSKGNYYQSLTDRWRMSPSQLCGLLQADLMAENLKDRRKYFYKVSLQPLSTDPASFSKGKQETLKSKSTPVSQLQPRLIVSKGSLAASSTPDASDCRLDTNSVSRAVTTSFVTPFMKNFDVSACDRMVNSPRQDRDTTKDIRTDVFDLVSNICYARDMQEMRVRKKQRQKIKPQQGSLYRQKTTSTDRISLVAAVGQRQPTKYSSAELYRCGVIKNHIGINSEKARNFEFHCLDYFTRESFFAEGGVQIADGGWLVPADKLTAGREEFYR